MVDQLYQQQAARFALQKQVTAAAKAEATLKAAIIDTLVAAQATSIAGDICRVDVVSRRVVTFTDVEKVFAWIDADPERRHFIAPRQLNVPAFQELVDQYADLPLGAEVFNVKKLSIHKRK